MSKIVLGDLWIPVKKGGHFPAEYVRSKHVLRSSEKVKIVNKKLAEVAKSCKGFKTSDGSFQECVRKNMEGFKATTKKK